MAKDKHKGPFKKWFLAEWREYRNGVSQDELAGAVGKYAGDISKYESGARRYNQELLEDCAKFLKCTPAALLAFDPINDPISAELWEAVQALPKKKRKRALNFIRDMAREDEDEAA